MKIKQSMSSRFRRSLAAFSLIEVTVGMGVMGTVVGALLTGITGGFFTMRMARENLRATQIILEKVETIRLYSWDQINQPGFIPPDWFHGYPPNGAPNGQGMIYPGSLTITNAPIASSYSSDMRMVTVRLNWKTGSIDRSREFSSYISRYGLQDYIY